MNASTQPNKVSPKRSTRDSTKLSRIVPQLFIYLLFTLITLIVLFPVTVNVFAAFKSKLDLAGSFPFAPPKVWKFSNITEALERGNMLVGFKNTAILVVTSVFINTVLGSMTAYILNRFDFRLKRVIFALFTVAMLVPFYTTEVSRFQIIKSLGLYNTLYGPMLIYIGTDLLQIFIYLQFISKISKQLDESGMMDGASYFRIYISIIFPLMLPASATLGIIKAVDIMNDMYVPYLYMPDKDLNTLSTALMSFVGQRASDWNQLAAAILIVLLPTLLIYLFMQRFIFAGITEGAVKG